MAKFKVAVVDALLPLTDIERGILEAVGCEVTQTACANAEEIVKVAADADAVMTVGAKLTAEVIAQLKNCKIIGRYGVGIDNVDLDAATAAGIVVTYVPVYCQEEVATLAVTLLLAAERRLIQADRVVKTNWKGSLKAVNGARSLKGKTLGLVGFGAIGREVVPLIQPFGVKVIAYDPFINLDYCKQLNVESVSLDTIIDTADYISLHVPLLPETRHMFSDAQFERMKDDAIIINTGRGALIDQAALYRALKAGKIAAAGIDVLETEPPDQNDPIFTLDNCITSGHIGAATNESVERLRAKVAQGVANVLTGKWPDVIANPKIKEKLSLQ